MLRTLLLSVLVTWALAEPRYLEDLDFEQRIVGGQHAKPNSWPWQVSVKYTSDMNMYHTCGGILIRPAWVLTAAHCVDKVRNWQVILGDHHIYEYEGHEQLISVKYVYVYPKWNSNNVAAGYDIALLHLSSDAVLDSYVQLATLPSAGQVLPHDYPCYITGWGRTSYGGSISALLKQAPLSVVDYSTCSRMDWWGRTVKDTMICAGDGTLAGCQGDSGGPLNCLVDGQYVVHGVTSFVAVGCNTYKKPTVFTRVSAYISWINETIE